LKDYTSKLDFINSENKKLKEEIIELENNHNVVSRDLSASKKVKIELEDTNKDKLDKLLNDNYALLSNNNDLNKKITQLEKNRSMIQSKIELTMEDYKKACVIHEELETNNK